MGLLCVCVAFVISNATESNLLFSCKHIFLTTSVVKVAERMTMAILMCV